MEVKELKINNIVSIVGQPGGERFNYSIPSGQSIDMIFVERNNHYPKPIPLTEEWLVRFDVLFGFNHCGSYYSFELGLDGYDLRLNYGIGLSKYIGSCKYLHQLQNLYFALTNEELTIK